MAYKTEWISAGLGVPMETKVRKCGDDLVITLPDQLVKELAWGSGDIIDVEVVDLGFRVVRTKTAYDHAMETAREVMDEYHETFAALAKS